MKLLNAALNNMIAYYVEYVNQDFRHYIKHIGNAYYVPDPTTEKKYYLC